MKIKTKDRKRLLKAALGMINSDTVIKNANLVNVITGEIYLAHVYILDNMISHVEWKDLASDKHKAEHVIDAKGRYLIPGFIDAHIHIESSMMTPRNFAKVVIPHGTTTIVTDPHEIANVWGLEGVRYMYDSSENLPMRQFINVPSCVPAAPGMENSGAVFTEKEIEELADLERVIGLAEVMDFLAVMNGEDDMMNKLDMAEAKNLYLQGHAPYLSDGNLSAYLCGGPNTCHETSTSTEALEKLRNGMFVDARNSSILENVNEIWQGVKNVKFFDNLCFCTDDREADDLIHKGHVNDVVRAAIKCGMDPVTAIKSATLNTAREIHIENLGAIAPGYAADMILVDSLEKLKPEYVLCNGKIVAESGKLKVDIAADSYLLESKNSMFVKDLSIEDFQIKLPITQGSLKVNVMSYDNLQNAKTVLEEIEIKVENGKFILDDDLKFVAIINRHQGHDTIGLGVVKGFGIDKGAWASTISHDSHNLTIVYDDCQEALLAAQTLIECGGGMTVINDRQVSYTLELKLAGLMSLKSAEDLAEDNRKMKEAIQNIGLTEMENPLLRIVTLALPVIPDVKMSDLGLIDVMKKEIIPLLAS